ncbi:MAG: cell division protein FtsQ/DivIB [bacterium]
MWWPFRRNEQKILRKQRLPFQLRMRLAFNSAVRWAMIGVTLSVVGGLAFLFYHFLFQSRFFRVHELDFEGFSPAVEASVRGKIDLDSLAQKNLLLLRTEEIEKKIEEHPRVRWASVSKQYPNSLKVAGEERQPEAMLHDRHYYLVDGEGVPLEEISQRDLKEFRYPFITGVRVQSSPLGKPVESESLGRALSLLAHLKEFTPEIYAQVSELNLSEKGELVVVLKGGVELLFGADDPVSKIPGLVVFCGENKDLGEFQYVDLRFDRQVVSLDKKNRRVTR